MSVNYKLIADNDPGGTLDAAFESMAAETTKQSKGKYLVNDLMIVNELGASDGHAFLDSVEASELLPERAKLWLRGNGIDVNHPDVEGILTAMNPPNIDKVLAMGDEVVPKYGAGFNEKQLNNARISRLNGAI